MGSIFSGNCFLNAAHSQVTHWTSYHQSHCQLLPLPAVQTQKMSCAVCFPGMCMRMATSASCWPVVLPWSCMACMVRNIVQMWCMCVIKCKKSFVTPNHTYSTAGIKGMFIHWSNENYSNMTQQIERMRYILVVVSRFSLMDLSNANTRPYSRSAAKFLCKAVFSMIWPSRYLRQGSDNGPHFVSEVIKTTLTMQGMKEAAVPDQLQRINPALKVSTQSCRDML